MPFAHPFTLSSPERLLPSHRAIPAPFTQEECQELMTLIRSFGGMLQTCLLFFNEYTYMRPQMTTMMIMGFKPALFLGFSSELVSHLRAICFQLGSQLSMFFPAHWRQTYFRPNKPLPANAGSNSSRLPMAPRKPFRRAIVDFVVSCLFLGIPYIFYERTRLSSRIDEESGLRNATPTLVIGACTCLVVSPSPFLTC